jgi:hypothetical protein
MDIATVNSGSAYQLIRKSGAAWRLRDCKEKKYRNFIKFQPEKLYEPPASDASSWPNITIYHMKRPCVPIAENR